MFFEPNAAQAGQLEWLEQMPGGVFVYRADEDEKILYVNQKVLDIFECNSAEEFLNLTGGSFKKLVYPADLKDVEKDIQRQVKARKDGFDHIDYRIVTRKGQVRYVEDFGRLVDLPGIGRAFVVFLVDVHAKYMSYGENYGTELPDSRRFLQYMSRVMRAMRTGMTTPDVSVLFFNIRNFRLYNVKQGTKQGDQVLQDIATLLQNTFLNDFVARFAVDHFVVLAHNDKLLLRVQKVYEQFMKKYGDKDMMLKVGIYPVQSGADEPAKSCDCAKIACESIRNDESAFYCFYDEKQSERTEISEYVIREIDNALRNRHVKVYFQPVVRTISGEICGAEALARWDDPEKGLLSPGLFIPALEESKQITKLDLYMIEEICRQMRERINNKEVIVPVSFNLSRLDFLNCDIVEAVESRLNRYDIPRDLIHVEITESMLVDDNDLIQREVKRFHDAGYQVWMDDFGSGYSSLNVLKDYEFDELKIDMVFLSSFTKKSKDIITSVVDMAKKLGIQTLAEGVETKEQFEFLRSIGCEKVQGYYFGRPMPVEQMVANCTKNNLHFETRSWRPYYNQIGKVNFITDRSLAIVEDDGTTFQFLFCNQRFLDTMRVSDVHDFEGRVADINSGTSPLFRQFRMFVSHHISTEVPESMDYVVQGNYMRMNIRLIASKGGKNVYQVENVNLNREDDEEHKKRADTVFRQMYLKYDAVYVADFESQQVEPVIYQMYDGNNGFDSMRDLNVAERIAKAIPLYIYPADQKRFADWINLDTLAERVAAEQRGYITDYFRTREKDGSFAWKVHDLLFLPGENGSKCVYTIKYAPFDKTLLPNQIIKPQKVFDTNEEHLEICLWNALSNASGLKMFWKDKDRRFVGVSRSLLEYYGIKDEQLIGKNDEEMRWHINNSPYYEDERSVLDQGEVIYAKLEKSIAKGVERDIVASKIPIFQDGKIIGILGYFFELNELSNENGIMSMTDYHTGLMNGNGMINALSGYVEGQRLRDESFALIRIRVPNYLRIYQEYGEEIGEQLLQQIGQIMLETVGKRAICCRIYEADFCVAMQYENQAEIEEAKALLEQKICAIHAIGNCEMTVTTETIVVYSDREKKLEDMIHLAVHPVEEEK